ncbi:hypothetical protein Tco_0654265 [Tanacetum coccineum]|uniref:Uncharacterized protein n=1 Tax=Tanacetum coccineum TaxID=301880 RepID=A0ABQ4X2T1_9ASTR
MYYQVFRGDGSSKNYKILSEMLEDFDRLDVEELYRLVKNRYSASSPEGFDLMLWGDLHTLFEPDEEDEIWKDQHEYKLLSWRLYDFCGIHILLMENGLAIHMLTEKKYPLSQEMLTKMLSKKLEVDHESSQAFELLRGPLVRELILEFLSTLRFGEVLLDFDAPGRRWSPPVLLGPPSSYTLIRDPVLRLCHRMMAHSIAGKSQAPEKVTVTDLFYLRGLDVRSVNIPYLLARYLMRFAAGRKSEAHIFGKLVRLQICMEVDDTWVWVAIGPERQPDAATGAPIVANDAPAVDEGDQAILAPVQAPQQPPPPPLAAAQTIPQRLRRLEEEVQGLRKDVRSCADILGICWDFLRELTCSIPETHQVEDWRAITSAAQQDPQQPDP